jgi:Fe-S-cluster-containing dehydrogenase component
MKRHHIVIDVEKCENCGNCFLACKDEHVGNEWPGYAASQKDQGAGWITVYGKERGQYPLIDVAYLPVPCMHCDDAPCVKAGKGAVTKRADGVVLIDPVAAKGRKDLLATCPYGSIQWNDESDLPQKCTLCAHLLDKDWTKPRCVQSCPTGALTFVSAEDRDMERLVTEEELEAYKPGVGTRPIVYYKNLYRFTHCFIAGSIATTADGKEECVEGATVTLLNSSNERVAVVKTDCFGDFTFDRLPARSGKYTVEVSYRGAEATVLADVAESVNVGTIRV